MTQCTQGPSGRGLLRVGASGSSQISAKDLVPSGALAHAKGGETSLPTPVYFSGIVPPSVNALLVSFMLFSSLSESRDVVDAGKLRRWEIAEAKKGPHNRPPSRAVTACHAAVPLLFPTG